MENTQTQTMNEESDSVTTTNNADPELLTRKPADTAIRQQRIKAWHPILDPLWVIITFLIMGGVFVPVGFKLRSISDGVVELKETYDAKPYTQNCSISRGNQNKNCMIELKVDRDMSPPVLVYYEIDKFHQNHFKYQSSKDSKQLYGEKQEKKGADLCKPLHKLGNVTLNPCGLIANTLFNDVITLKSGKDENDINLTMIETGIAWKSDLDYVYRQPNGFNKKQCDSCDDCSCDGSEWSCKEIYEDPKTKKCWKYNYPDQNSTQYLYQTYPKVTNPLEGVENEHFAVWMRTAALPKFRKLYGYFNKTIKKGETLSFNINANWVVKDFEGSKTLIVTTTSIFGGRNPKFAKIFIYGGYACLCVGILFWLKHFFQPRRLADPKYLKYKAE